MVVEIEECDDKKFSEMAFLCNGKHGAGRPDSAASPHLNGDSRRQSLKSAGAATMKRSSRLCSRHLHFEERHFHLNQ